MAKVKFNNEPVRADILSIASVFARENLQEDLPFCESVIQLFRAGRYSDGVRSLEAYVRPEFGPYDSLFKKRQFAALFSKVPFKGSQKLRRLAALESFHAAERQCGRANRRLGFYSRHPERENEIYRLILSRAKAKIVEILGGPVVTDGQLKRLLDLSRPGKGISVGTRNKFRTSLPYKLADTDLAVSPSARWYANLLVSSDHHWFKMHGAVDFSTRTYTLPFVDSESCRITCVPKNARTDRTIGVEPALNVQLQLGVHELFADLLSRIGNSIHEGGQARNQELARLGSLNPYGERSAVTIDLKSASDTVCTSLVERLFPREWVALLDDLRCKSYLLDGQIHRFQKWSSMGNGYTFVLETLIFYALGSAVNSLTGGRVLSVYGDDIIVEKGSALLLLEILRYCGFTPNGEKTSILGGFRESCGADWYFGLAITPQYQRRLTIRPTDIHRLLNRLDRRFCLVGLTSELLRAYRASSPILYGLVNEDDTSCLFASFQEVKARGFLTWRPRIQNWTFQRWEFSPEKEDHRAEVMLAVALRGGGQSSRPTIRGRGRFRLRHATAGCGIN